jgi:hypothetical protein
MVKYYDVSERNTASIFKVTELTQVEIEVIWRKKMSDFDWPNSIKPAYISHSPEEGCSKFLQNAPKFSHYTVQKAKEKKRKKKRKKKPSSDVWSSIHKLTLLTAAPFSILNEFQKKMNDTSEASFLGNNFTIKVTCPHILYTHLLANLPAQFLCTEY